MSGPRLAGQVAAAVSLVEAPSNCGKAAAVAKEAMAIMPSNRTSLSIEKFLDAPFAGKHPKLIKKGTKAAAAEATATAAEAIAVADLEEAKRDRSNSYKHSEKARAPHTNGPRDVPRCGALSLLQKMLHYKEG